MSLLYGHYIKVTSSLQRIVDYLVIESPKMTGQVLPNLVGNIEFKDVMFRYPKRPESMVLKKINLKLESGKVTALCGSSGTVLTFNIESLMDIATKFYTFCRLWQIHNCYVT